MNRNDFIWVLRGKIQSWQLSLTCRLPSSCVLDGCSPDKQTCISVSKLPLFFSETTFHYVVHTGLKNHYSPASASSVLDFQVSLENFYTLIYPPNWIRTIHGIISTGHIYIIFKWRLIVRYWRLELQPINLWKWN